MGADADIAIWDPKREVVIQNELLHHDVDYTPYEGRVVIGWPVLTLSRGKVVWRDGEVLGQAGDGRFRPAASRTWPNPRYAAERQGRCRAGRSRSGPAAH
ncbi:hypothetical protein MBH78_18680 [Oceanimonas sp. NS1]|nr:hypothetical protein [Oceanimonas sp. NS1]